MCVGGVRLAFFTVVAGFAALVVDQVVAHVGPAPEPVVEVDAGARAVEDDVTLHRGEAPAKSSAIR